MWSIFGSKRCQHGSPIGPNKPPCAKCVLETQQAREEEKARVLAKRNLEQRVSHLLQAEVRRLRELTPTLDELRRLKPRHFEDSVALSFSRQGYQVEQTPYIHDGGYDGILKKEDRTLLYECKRYGANSVSGRPELQKLHSVIISKAARSGCCLRVASAMTTVFGSAMP
jgi:restriction endonuclease Mrr